MLVQAAISEEHDVDPIAMFTITMQNLAVTFGEEQATQAMPRAVMGVAQECDCFFKIYEDKVVFWSTVFGEEPPEILTK